MSTHRQLSAGSEIRVKFVDFWPQFDPYAYLIPLLNGSPFYFKTRVVGSESADIEIHSVFRSRAKRILDRVERRTQRILTQRTTSALDPRPEGKPGPFRIWLTGENLRPPCGPWNATLSFDADSPGQGNAYFPLWWQMFPELLGIDSRARPGIVQVSRFWPLDTFLEGRDGTAGERERFACAVISNPEPTRLRAITALNEIGEVDVFGRVTGQAVTDKNAIFQQYKFVLCFESDVYPGYVTEKVFDAWGSGAIPLWWGLDRESFLNPASLLNLADHRNLDAFVESVADLASDRGVLDSISSQPLLQKRPNLDAVRQILARVLLGTNGWSV
jgi:hypothetical protein